MTGGPAPLQGVPLLLSALAISVVAFIEVLDMTIVNVAVPAIAGDLGVSPNEATWAISSYAMAAAAVQPLTGWLTKRFGQVRLFIGAAVLFTLASLLCSLAWDLASLVGFRLVQGFVSGPMLPLSQALMLASFPSSKRGMALGVWAGTILSAPVFGPIVGGWITDNWSWRACFYINLPIGVFSVAVLWALLRQYDSQPTMEPVDAGGAVLLIVGVASVQFLLDHGNQEDWFASPLIRGLAVMAALALALFAVWERYERYPVIDFSLFRQRSFVVAVIGGAVAHGAFFGSTVLHPLWMQTAVGYTATQAGMALVGYGVAAMITSLVFGALIYRIPTRVSVNAGLLMFVLGAVLQARLTLESGFADHFWARVPQGFGITVFQMCMTSLALSQLPERQYPAATGVMMFSRVLAGSMVVALSVWLWELRAKVHYSLLAEGYNPVTAVGIEMPSALATWQLPLLDHLAQARAQSQAFADLCWLYAAVFAALMLWMLAAPDARRVAGA